MWAAVISSPLWLSLLVFLSGAPLPATPISERGASPLIDGDAPVGDGLLELPEEDLPNSINPGGRFLDEELLLGVGIDPEDAEGANLTLGAGLGGASNGSEGLGSTVAPTEAPPPPPRIPFSVAPVNKTYEARDDFSPLGMEHLYLITNMFLESVHREQELPPELVALIEREIASPSLDMEQAARVAKDLEANWDSLLFHYVGLTVLVVLGLLLGLVTPVVGLVFACCRCGGRCGGDYPTYDKKGDPCKRGVLGTLLATLVVVLLLGLVCSFVTNARMESGIQSLPSELEVSVRDTKLYLNNTHKEVKTLMENNFDELKKVLFTKLEKSGELINGELARVSKAIAIENLTSIASSLTAIKADLHVIRNTTVQLQEETSNLQLGLQDVAGRLNELKESCEGIPECLRLISKYSSKLEISNVFQKLPNVSSKLDEVSALIANGIEVEVKRGKRDFDSIEGEIQKKVKKSIPQIKEQIEKKRLEMKNVSHELGLRFDQIEVEKANQYIQMSRHYINEYSLYRYWSLFLVCVLLLLVTFCFAMGVLIGCCGRRPDEATACYKTMGTSWLMWGVGLTFLFSTVIMVTTSSMFLVGSLVDLLVCDPLRDPTNSEVFSIAQQHVHLNKYFPPGDAPVLSEVIRKCHGNASLYAVLNLRSYDGILDNLTNYRDFLKLDEKISRIKTELNRTIDTNVQILSREAKQQLMSLAKSSLADNHSWDHYTDILEQEVLTIDLLDLAAQLNQTADDLPPNYHEVSRKLKNDAIYLEGLRRWLSSIKTNTGVLKSTTARLEEALKFNKTSLGLALEDLMTKAEFAQTYLRVNGSAEVIELVTRFTEDFLSDIDHYVSHVRDSIVDRVGRCAPMSTVYNATTAALCKNILYPFNGYWASVGWCFLFFLPCMALAVQLASLYMKTEAYSGQLTESEYLYDAYDERNSRAYLNHESMYDAFAERDNIPLTSGCDKKPRRRSREYDCPPRVTGTYASEPYSAPPHASPLRPDYPPPSNDWGEYPPAGGPPRYTSQPSLSPEYERPPPYYYPGPGGAQYYGGAGGPPPQQQGASAGGGASQVVAWGSNAPRYGGGGGGGGTTWKISPAYTKDEYDA